MSSSTVISSPGSEEPDSLRILEIGSGVSPLKRFRKNVLTSDVLQLDYLDYVFDCHEIDRFDSLADKSLDAIVLTNVLHHLRDPIGFLNKAAGKLKQGGQVIATEPYFSLLSNYVYKHVHHEPVDLEVSQPILSDIKGPLASANIALPWLIFIKNPAWHERLRSRFEFDLAAFRPFSSISYMATGGISHRLPLPSFLYRPLFHLDLFVSRFWPKLCASFFTIRLIRK